MRFWILALLMGCNAGENLQDFCGGAKASSYAPSFKVWCPTVEDNYLPLEYGEKPQGEQISPPIEWSGLPDGTERLRIRVVDATCTYDCNRACKFHHWILDIPVKEFPKGIEQGAANRMQPYTLENGLGKKVYQPFVPPLHQTHAIVYQLIAYKKEGKGNKILGRSQSTPYLFSLLHK